MAATVTYTPPAGSPVTVQAIVGRRDVVADLEGRPVAQDVLAFEFQRAELPADPERGAMIGYLGGVYRVGRSGEVSPDGRTVSVEAARA